MTGSRDILLVEDNADDEFLTLRALRRSQLPAPVILRDGAEALAYLFGQAAGRDPAQLPAVILLDLKLPKVDGLDVLRRIRADARTRLVRVVVLTSSNEPPDIQASYELGADSFVRKPVEFETYIEAVGLVGRYWAGLNEPPI